MVQDAAANRPSLNLPRGLEERRGELARRIGSLAPNPGSFTIPWLGLRCVRRNTSTEITRTFYEPSLCVVAQGSKRVVVGDRACTYDKGHYLLASVALPAASRVSVATPDRPFLAVSLRLDMKIVSELIPETGGRPSATPESHRGLWVSQVTEPLLDAMVRLLQLLDTPQDIPVLGHLYEREIYYRLLTGEQGSRLRSLALHDGRVSRVAKAMAWLETNYMAPIDVGELARSAQMSSSSLYHHFKAVTGLSPLQYQKQLRLRAARKLVLTGVDAASAGFQVGYESPSHFNREYRRLFGNPPGRDRAQFADEP